MADAQIVVSGVIVVPGVRQNIVRWTAAVNSCLPYLALDRFEVWGAAANNLGAATKVGEVGDVQFTHGGLTLGVPVYYWVRPRDVAGNLGDFFPLSPTGGIIGTPTSTGPGSVTPPDIDVPKLSDLSGDFGIITAGLIQSPDGKMVIDLRTGFTKRIRISS